MKKGILLKEFLLVVTTILWGLGFIFQSIAGRTLDAYSISFFRVLIAAVFLFILSIAYDLLRIKKNIPIPKENKKDLFIQGIIIGVIITLAMICQQIGIIKESAGKAGFLTTLYIVFVPIITSLFGKKMTVLSIISVLLSLTGIFLINYDDSGFRFSLGTVLLIACALCYAIQILMNERNANIHDPIKLAFVEFITSIVILFPLMLIFGDFNSEGFKSALPSIIFIGVFPSGLAYAFQIFSQKGLNPTLTCIIMSLESVFALAFSLIILHEEFTLLQLIGCIIIFAAVTLTQIKFKKKEKNKTTINE